MTDQKLQHQTKPQKKCPLCGKPIILCWGPFIKPYWRHKSSIVNQTCKCDLNGEGESDTHLHAKKLLITYLQSGGTCIFTHMCRNNKIKRYTISSTRATKSFETEVSYKNCRFDIGGFNDKGELCFGIEIRYKHATDNIINRNDIHWVEVGAIDVISWLDHKFPPDQIDLSDDKICPGCDIKNFQLKQFALEMNYLIETEDIPEVKYLQIKQKGCYNIYQVYGKKSFPSPDHLKLWATFESRKKCICCYVTHEVTNNNPYCNNCYKNKTNIKITTTHTPTSDEIQKIYESIEAKKHVSNTCIGNGECLRLSTSSNNIIIAKKYKHYECEYDCKLCPNFSKCMNTFRACYDKMCLECLLQMKSDTSDSD